MSQTTASRYVLDNTSEHATQHHQSLAELLDPGSRRRTLDLLDHNLAGLTALEVGAGHGGYARWLADEVGPTGHVTALDLSPERIPPHPQLEIIKRDVTKLEPLPHGPVDFVHSRLMLQHLPAREQVLRWMVSDAVLKPGGVVLLEDWDASRTDMVLSAPSEEDRQLYDRFQEIIGGKVFAASGTDRGWARRVLDQLITLGLADVNVVIASTGWAGGTAGGRLVAASIRQTYDQLVQVGMTGSELDHVRDLLEGDPRLVLVGHLLYATSGRKPA
jgi:ubiquinone/menaquinone biosynthesis C-methylase UbiE